MKKVLLVLSLIMVLSANVFANKYFIMAALNNDFSKVEEYISSGVDINAKADNGWNALMLASSIDSIEITKLLINNGANIHAKDNYGMTALIWACANGATSAVELLIGSGADINIEDNIGRTALILACANGHTETVKLLLSNGADIEPTITGGDYKGYTVLMIAEKFGYTDIANLLKASRMLDY